MHVFRTFCIYSISNDTIVQLQILTRIKRYGIIVRSVSNDTLRMKQKSDLNLDN